LLIRTSIAAVQARQRLRPEPVGGAGLSQVGGDLVRAGRATVADDAGAAGGERFGDGAADAAGAACDEDVRVMRGL
jgi:hypothetical protein